MSMPADTPTLTIRVIYSDGDTWVIKGWTHGMVDRLRASWAEITDPRSTATIEVVDASVAAESDHIASADAGKEQSVYAQTNSGSCV